MTRGTNIVALAALASSVLAMPPLRAQSRWTEVRGDGFTLQGQISADGLNKVACDLNTAVRILRPARAASSSSSTSAPDDAVVKVVAVDSGSAIREWLPPSNPARRENPLGAYWHGLFGHHIVVRVDTPPAERLRRGLHEYAHFVTHDSNPDAPRWFDEGVSEIWEHATSTSKAIRVGQPVAEHVKRLKSAKEWIAVKDLVAATEIPGPSNPRTEMFYAESWALVHYLMFKKKPARAMIERVPVANELPTDDELKAYTDGKLAPSLEILTTSATPCEPSGPLRAIPPFDALLGRAQALADSDRPDTALPLLREALAAHPTSVEAEEILGFVHFTGNRPAEAAQVFDEIIESGQASFISYYYRAVLAGPIPNRKNGGKVPEIEYLRKAVALNPRFGPAVQRLRELTGGY